MNHTITARVYYEDTDCGGVVYYANYLRYFEWGRTHFLEDLGFDLAHLAEQGTLFVAVRAEIDYKAPARYGDNLRIGTTLSDLGAASLVFHHRVTRDDTPLATGTVKLASVDPRGAVRRIAPNLRGPLQHELEPTT